MTTLEDHPIGQRLITGRFLLVMLATGLYFTALGMQLPTIPTYVEDELGGGGIAVGFAAGIFAFSAAIIRPWAGRLGDRKGRRILMVGGAGRLTVRAAAGCSWPIAVPAPSARDRLMKIADNESRPGFVLNNMSVLLCS